MFSGRRSQAAIPLLIFYLILNVLTYILISAFITDDVIIGSPSTNTLLANESRDSGDDVSVLEAKGWFASFKNVIFGIPWWAVSIWVFLDITLLVVIGLAFIRGI